jgi:hypothetical protein
VNVLVAQQGGLLVLDEAFDDQPTAATVTLVTLDNQPLSRVNGSFTDIEDEVCNVSDMVLTLPASNRGCRLFVPTTTAGVVDDMVSPGYQLLINRGGRRYYARVGEYDTAAQQGGGGGTGHGHGHNGNGSGLDVTSFMLDEGVDFAVKAGDTAKGIRVSYDVDWSAVTDENFVGQVQALWKVTVNGRVQRIRRVYDVVKQILTRQATWADVLARRPDADENMSQVRDKEKLVITAWEDVVRELYTLGIRHNLLIPTTSTSLRDATVLQVIYNLTVHQSLAVPPSFMTQPDVYLDNLRSEKSKTLAMLAFPVDEDQNMVISSRETMLRATCARSGRLRTPSAVALSTTSRPSRSAPSTSSSAARCRMS